MAASSSFQPPPQSCPPTAAPVRTSSKPSAQLPRFDDNSGTSPAKPEAHPYKRSAVISSLPGQQRPASATPPSAGNKSLQFSPVPYSFLVSHNRAASPHNPLKSARVFRSCLPPIPFSFAPANRNRSSALPYGSCARPDVTCPSTASSASNIPCSKFARSPNSPPKSPSPPPNFSESTPPSSSPTSSFPSKSWDFPSISPREKALSSKSPSARPKTSRN